MRRTPDLAGAAALAAGLVAVVCGGLLVTGAAAPSGFGEVAGASTPATAVRTPAVAGHGARVAEPPVGLRLPRLGVSARVVPVTTTGGALVVPDDPAVLGWWSGGGRPGQGAGTVAIDGHVDSARYGVGVLARLRDVRPGDRVVLADREGRATAYVVSARRDYPKSALPAAALFDQSVSERLLLVTCGGGFDRRTHHYSDNVVVLAVPVEPRRQ